ncbi:MAG TPA: type II toxin-antitoxin system VapC family toxin [Longimicrobiales bacterium]|nr:type II toxin-antitoxin system VapC family toxin [Longimicrobiales bacterium]
MTFYYLESSALVKAYVLEPGSDRVREIIAAARAEPPATRVLVSVVAFPEVASAVSRRARPPQSIDATTADRLLARLDADFFGPVRPYVLVNTNEWIARDAASHTRTHKLRGYDAVHLATALACRHSAPLGTDFVFVSADDDLIDAASAEGFVVEEIPTEWPEIPRAD